MTLLYFANVPWNSFTQRAHAFVRWYHRRHRERVVWIDPYPGRLPELNDLRRLMSRSWGLGSTGESKPDWLTVMDPGGLPIEPIPGLRHFNELRWTQFIEELRKRSNPGVVIGIGKPSRLAARCLRELPHACSFLDVMDNVKAMYSGVSARSMQLVEQQILETVDIVLASATSLYDDLRQRHDRVIQVRNGFDDMAVPFLSKRPKSQKPRLGYLGAMAKWFDWAFIMKVAALRPDAEISLIGPRFREIPDLPSNVSVHPPVRHPDAVKVMATFDVGMIPFKVDELTEAVDPIKYYEYRALGLPVLATHFGELKVMAEHDAGLYTAVEDGDLNSSVQAALEHQDNEASISRFRSENSWDGRFAALPQPLG